jgi:DNA adenine methylase
VAIPVCNSVKPIFKYIGGKSWLKDTLRKKATFILHNNNVTEYVEPFCGGLGSFLAIYDILLEYQVKKVVLNDINPKLINFYQQVKENPLAIVEHYLLLEKKFESLIPENINEDALKTELIPCNTYFKSIREEFNKNKQDKASSAYLLFLQNHSFNGVYRENLKGEYNTPFNWSTKRIDINVVKQRILEVNRIFSLFDIQLINIDFSNLIFKKSAFIYCDPPYANETINANQYSKDTFNSEKQKKLIEKLKQSNCSFLYSNNYLTWLIDCFDEKHTVEIVHRKNIMSCKHNAKGEDKKECLICHKNIIFNHY